MKTDYEAFANANSRVAFRRYVTRVAFQLTLSEPMIAALKYCRDDPGHTSWTDSSNYKKGSDYDMIRAVGDSRTHLFIVEMKALERRGLVFHNPTEKPEQGHVFHKLTRVGELTCELLVVAGLMMPAAAPRRKKARAA